MKIKLKDLAEELDISIAAVSMALNHKKGVSDETRERVLELARSKGYKIKDLYDEDSNASEVKKYIKLLRVKKHGLVAMDTAFFSRIIEGIEEECRKHRYDLLVSNHNLEDLGIEWIENEFRNNVQGMIVLATELGSDDVGVFDALDQPFVMLDSYIPGKPWDFILMNNHSAFYQGVEYLIKSGHKSIGYLKSNTAIYNFDERFRSYMDALDRFNMAYEAKYTIALEPTLNGAYDDMKAFLDTSASFEFPTAFLADNDLIAVGAMNALRDHGYLVPDEISIIGFDDMPIAQVVHPRLTTSHVFKKDIGREAVRTLMSKIKHQNRITQKKELNTKLVVRDSVKNR